MSEPRGKLDVFELLDALDRTSNGPSGEGSRLEAAADSASAPVGSEGRVFRVKLGFNPNSSSLGTSVVTLMWGVGLAGLVFQWMGSWLLQTPTPEISAGPAQPDDPPTGQPL